MLIKYIQKCRICGNPNLVERLSLGQQTVQGAIIKDGKPIPPQRKIDSRLLQCDIRESEDGCGLVQMNVTIDSKILYSNYSYRSSVSNTMRNWLKKIADEAFTYFPSENWDTYIVDCGGNDGTWLNYFPNTNNLHKVLIDPSDIAGEVKDDKIKVFNECFPSQNLNKYCENGVNFFASFACFYDISSPIEFAKSVKNLLTN